MTLICEGALRPTYDPLGGSDGGGSHLRVSLPPWPPVCQL